MLKVKFVDTTESVSKVIIKKGKKTVVTLKGVIETPAFWHQLPPQISEWIIGPHRTVVLLENPFENHLIIVSEGVATLHSDDKYDALIGERVAESKAMYKIYDFLYKLTFKLCKYYHALLFGHQDGEMKSTGWSLEAAMKKYEKLRECEKQHLERILEEKKVEAKNKQNG